MRLLAVIVMSVVATATLSAQQWPSFRGANAAGVADGKTTAVKWNTATGENVVWKTAMPGVAVSSPIVWGDRVFVSTAVSSDPNVGIRTGLYGDVEPVHDASKHSWHLIALDKGTGKIVWDRVAHEGIPKTKRHPKSSQASPTPVTDGQRVIVSFGSEGLYAYDFDGKLLWNQDLGILNAGWFYDPDYEWGVGSSPIIWKNLVIVQCDIQKGSFVAAFDVATGKQAWRTAREEIPVVVHSNRHRIERPCRARHAGDDVHARIRPSDRQGALAARRKLRDRDSDANRRTRLHNRHERLSGCAADLRHQAWRNRRHHAEGRADEERFHGVEHHQRRTVHSHTDHLRRPVVRAAQQRRARGVQRGDGYRVYQERLGGTGGSFSASPVAADGKLYLTSEDGDVFVVKAGPTYELLAKNSMGEVLMATPAVSEGLIIVRGLKNVYAIGSPERSK